MNTGRTVFAQLMDLLPLAEFRRSVDRYEGDYKVQSFSCLDQFLCLAFAQLTFRDSLRDIETCLRAHPVERHQHVNRGGGRDLSFHGIEGEAEKALDEQMLLDPLEEQLDLLTAFAELGDGGWGLEPCISNRAVAGRTCTARVSMGSSGTNP